MDQIVKMNYWDANEITNEAYEHFDGHWAIETLLLDTLVFIIDDLRLGRVENVALTNFSKAIDRIAEESIKEGSRAGDNADKNDLFELTTKYSHTINSLLLLQPKYLKQRDKAFSKSLDGKNFSEHMLPAERISEDMDNFERSPITDLVAVIPDLIDIKITFNNKQINQLKEQIQKYLNIFVNNEFESEASSISEKKMEFSRQIVNFTKYLNSLVLVQNSLSIPFSALKHPDFDLTKMMNFLKQKGSLDFRWSQSDCWNVKIKNRPITVDTLLNAQVDSELLKTSNEPELKFNLSFSEDPAYLLVTDNEGNETKIKIQGRAQKDVLRLIFTNPKNTYGSWSLEGIEEIFSDGSIDAKSAKNAIYQFNKKVRLEIPSIRNLFNLTKYSAQIDPKYVNVN
jgi:hypothetical protein